MLLAPKFQKRKENFICENCGAKVSGTGYTDHCPKCLYSKHVDVNPGDRAEGCHGIMRPTGISGTPPDNLRIDYRCEKCGKTHTVKTAENDNAEEIIAISQSAGGS